MNGQLITFAEVKQRQEIDLIGGQLELDISDATCRGTVCDIFWWNNYPRRFNWIHEMTWNSKAGCWKEQFPEMKSFSFDFRSIEFFSGPYELDTGEIFFLYNDTSAITMYPQSCTPPEGIQSGQLYQSLRRCFEVTSRR